ncbi:type II 3-dehydroquinate dehydratase [Blochmannia endosymbiont of Camponotus nipponensis]|uniref:type II 3-dehydroquinate dehydratase n=1 Tax=Blochmannia endosymbiont of Camponotus nipponensis TaxID=2681986 RepID=UPI0013597727|nr:type II 3-dehydroquinate dehydratase [Blochmannia endosymbiont of Camponotus nipponensis]
MINTFHILLMNGPNLNLLGTREPHIYGYETLSDIVVNLYKTSESLGMKINHFQSNAEHELINCVHKNRKNTDFIIINPAAFTHTSVALRDAFLAVNISFIEVHLSNIYKREKFRYRSYLSDIALGVICGFGAHGYHFALHMAHKYLSKKLTNNK